jgi:hypothetical protein
MLLRLLLTASVLVTNVMAQTSTTHTYTANGRTFTYTLTIFQPPIAIQPDSSRLNQDSAVNCTILFISKLSQGDIAGAAAITNDPDTTTKLYADAKARIGNKEFSRQMANLFNGDRYRYELVEGNEHILISEKNPDGAQSVVEKDGKFWMDRPKFQHESQEFRDLFVLVNDHAAGKVEFK